MSFPHAENFTRWLGHLAGKPILLGLELGTFEGESAEWILQNIMTGIGTVLYCVDTWQGGEDHKELGFDWRKIESGARNRLERFGNAVRIRKDSTNLFFASLHYFEPQFDFVYVDASHTSSDVLRDAVFAFECLKPGGVMIFDDYKWSWDNNDLLATKKPKIAIDAFLACYAEQIEVLDPVDWQVAIRKK